MIWLFWLFIGVCLGVCITALGMMWSPKIPWHIYEDGSVDAANEYWKAQN